MDYYYKYLKYKNKYINLKKMLGGESNKLVLCFDFDLTLTNIQTSGNPIIGTEYFGNLENFKFIKDRLENLSSKHHLYIVTRGMEVKVKSYLESRDIMKYFKNVYGATSDLPIARDDWHKIKVDYLNKIIAEENIDKNHLYFYDDTKENIIEALKNGYINSFIVNYQYAGANLLNLLNFIFDRNQISDIVPGEYKLIGKKELQPIIYRDYLFNPPGQKVYIFEKDGKEFFIMKNDLIGINMDTDDGNAILKNGKEWLPDNPSDPVVINDIFKIEKVDLNLIKSHVKID